MLYGEQARFFEDEIRPELKHKQRGVVGMASEWVISGVSARCMGAVSTMARASLKPVRPRSSRPPLHPSSRRQG